MRSLAFWASKLAADIFVQEYGRRFGMPTCCLRCGCLTGPSHAGVELHGFLSYLIRCNVEGREYKVYGYKGKQVRDNIHAKDVAHFMWEFFGHPRVAEVYNLGGGKKIRVQSWRHSKLLRKSLVGSNPMSCSRRIASETTFAITATWER